MFLYTVACNCSRDGLRSGFSCNAENGQCECKQYVQGLKCDECMDGYYNLHETRTEGCIGKSIQRIYF